LPRYFLEISYKGTNFNGLATQIEGNPSTIQDDIERVFQILFKEKIDTHTSSRTDTGVHALQNFLHFDTELPIPDNFIYKFNAIVKIGIQARNIYLVTDDAHCRFVPLGRAYRYNINLNRNPFHQETAWNLPFKLDLSLLNQAAAILLNYKDYTSFSKKNTQTFTNLCSITQSEWRITEDGLLSYHVTSNRFLRGMVRALVATQINVASHKLSLVAFENLISSKIQASADFGAPGHGLFLEKIIFPEDFIKNALADSFVITKQRFQL
jgi:tRNA pseudouridine38-40 synthase